MLVRGRVTFMDDGYLEEARSFTAEMSEAGHGLSSTSSDDDALVSRR